MKIAVNLMGGDNSPGEIIKGCSKFINEIPSDELILYGTESVTEIPEFNILSSYDRVEFIKRDSAVRMDENPLVIKNEKSESCVTGIMRAVADGKADCAFSCGNSGATILSAITNIGMKPEISNVSLMSFIPVYRKDAPTGIIDVGALGNRPFEADTYFELAKLASDFYSSFFGNQSPSISILNIGTESWKGSKEHRKLFTLLKESDLNFYGNIEGDELLKGSSDIIICGGFTGNVILKLLESFYDICSEQKNKIDCDKENNFLNFIIEEFSYESIGGAPLLGIDGKVVLGHGKSTGEAVSSGLNFCREYVQKS